MLEDMLANSMVKGAVLFNASLFTVLKLRRSYFWMCRRSWRVLACRRVSAAYAMAKGAVEVDSLYGKKSSQPTIRVNTLAPGAIAQTWRPTYVNNQQ